MELVVLLACNTLVSPIACNCCCTHLAGVLDLQLLPPVYANTAALYAQHSVAVVGFNGSAATNTTQQLVVPAVAGG